MTGKERKSLPWRRFGYVILIIIKFSKLLLWIPLRIIYALRSYMKHSKECFIRYQNISNLVKKKRGLHRIFFNFSVFGYLMNHFLVLICYLNDCNFLKCNYFYQGELPMDTSEPADSQNGSQAGSNSSEGNTAAHSRYRRVCRWCAGSISNTHKFGLSIKSISVKLSQ